MHADLLIRDLEGSTDRQMSAISFTSVVMCYLASVLVVPALYGCKLQRIRTPWRVVALPPLLALGASWVVRSPVHDAAVQHQQLLLVCCMWVPLLE